jgi:hypothetical protein
MKSRTGTCHRRVARAIEVSASGKEKIIAVTAGMNLARICCAIAEVFDEYGRSIVTDRSAACGD